MAEHFYNCVAAVTVRNGTATSPRLRSLLLPVFCEEEEKVASGKIFIPLNSARTAFMGR